MPGAARDTCWCDPQVRSPLDVPDAFAIVERNLAVFADLEDGAKRAGGHRRGRPRALGDAALFEFVRLRMPQDGSGGEHPRVAVDDDGAVDGGEGEEDARIEIR